MIIIIIKLNYYIFNLELIKEQEIIFITNILYVLIGLSLENLINRIMKWLHI